MPRLPLIFLVRFQLFDTNELTSINENTLKKKTLNYSYPYSGQQVISCRYGFWGCVRHRSFLGSHSLPLVFMNKKAPKSPWDFHSEASPTEYRAPSLYKSQLKQKNNILPKQGLNECVIGILLRAFQVLSQVFTTSWWRRNITGPITLTKKLSLGLWLQSSWSQFAKLF